MTLEEEEDIFRDAELPLADEEEDEAMEEYDEDELDALGKENQPEDEDVEDDNEDDDVDAEEDDEDEENGEEDGDGDVEVDGEGAAEADGEADTEEALTAHPNVKKTLQTPSEETGESDTHNHSEKLQMFYNALAVKARVAGSYDISPTVAIPYSSQIHSIALSKSSKWLFTGGEDGFIRKYDFYGSIDGDVQLTAAQKHSLVDLISNGGSLVGYWENEIPVKRSTIRTDSYEPRLSPVYSLAVEDESLWILGGLANGGINLQSVRHSEGVIIHHFKKHTDTVSVLELNWKQDMFLSGSWDKSINLWDLCTGQVRTSFNDLTGQITSLRYRPTGGIDIATVKQQQQQQACRDDDDLDSLFGDDDNEPLNGANAKNNVTASQESKKTAETDENVFMSAAVDGYVSVWDTRASQPVLKIKSPRGTPPWCVSACWSTSGDSIFVGRRNSTVEEFSLKMPFSNDGEPQPIKVLKFPTVSGAVTAVTALPNHNHIVCGSQDNIRLYDLRVYPEAHKKTPFLIVPGHHGGVVSDIQFDPTYRYMISASGNRGWQGTSTETAFIYDVASD